MRNQNTREVLAKGLFYELSTHLFRDEVHSLDKRTHEVGSYFNDSQ